MSLRAFQRYMTLLYRLVVYHWKAVKQYFSMLMLTIVFGKQPIPACNPQSLLSSYLDHGSECDSFTPVRGVRLSNDLPRVTRVRSVVYTERTLLSLHDV